MVDLLLEFVWFVICFFFIEIKGFVLMNELMSKDYVCYNSMKVG